MSHSEISGSKVICTSPKLIAAYHVLHRLREPRHPPCALLYFLSVSREYLALPDGPGRFTQNSSCSALLRIPLGFGWLRIRSYHALWLYFPEHSAHQLSCHNVVLQPHTCRNMDGLGCSPFARHYWGNHCLFSFPAGTKMFQFPALASNNVG